MGESCPPHTRVGAKPEPYSLWRKLQSKFSVPSHHPPGHPCSFHTCIPSPDALFRGLLTWALKFLHKMPPYWEGWERKGNLKTHFPTHDSVPSTFPLPALPHHTPPNLIVYKSARDLFGDPSTVRGTPYLLDSSDLWPVRRSTGENDTEGIAAFPVCLIFCLLYYLSKWLKVLTLSFLPCCPNQLL